MICSIGVLADDFMAYMIYHWTCSSMPYSVLKNVLP